MQIKEQDNIYDAQYTRNWHIRNQRPYILTRQSALDHLLLNIAFFVQEEESFLYIAAFVQEEELFLTSCTLTCQIHQLRFVI